MLESSSPATATTVDNDVAGHIDTFIEGLTVLGYAERSRHRKRFFIEAFVRWAVDCGLKIRDVDEASLVTYLRPAPDRPRGPRNHEHAALVQFLEHLRGAGISAPHALPTPTSADRLLTRYVEHLHQVRGLAPHSIEAYSALVRTFVVAQRLDESLDPAVIRRFLLDRAQGRSSETTRLLAVALRSFLRFLFLHAETATDLSVAVPPVRTWQAAALPPLLSPEEVEKVIAATDSATVRGRRARAMLLLLARLGLRAGEVAALELDDIKWGTAEIVVHGKGGFCDRMPLLEDVGEALALYLRRDRGCATSRRVFLRLCPPHVGLTGSSAVSRFAHNALERAGVRPPGHVGAHIFRHSLATRMIRQGATLSEVSQALRHRCLDTTRHYARFDLESLRDVARTWPCSGGAR